MHRRVRRRRLLAPLAVRAKSLEQLDALDECCLGLGWRAAFGGALAALEREVPILEFVAIDLYRVPAAVCLGARGVVHEVALNVAQVVLERLDVLLVARSFDSEGEGFVD